MNNTSSVSSIINNNIEDVRKNLQFLGKGEENAVFLHRPQNVVIRISHRSPQTVRKPRQELARGLGTFTPKVLGVCQISDREIIAEIWKMASIEISNEDGGKRLTLLSPSCFILGLVMESALCIMMSHPSLSNPPAREQFQFEIKPKWGSKAMIKSIAARKSNNEKTEEEGSLNFFSLPEAYWKESKYFLKQKYKKKNVIDNEAVVGQEESSTLKYDPEKFFNAAVESRNAELLASSICDCYEDQKVDPSRNNFSISSSSSSTSAINMTDFHDFFFLVGSRALIQSGILDTLFDFQRFGEENKNSRSMIVIPILEAPLLDFALKNREKLLSKSIAFTDYKNNEIIIDEWSEAFEQRQIEKLYNATAARDVSIVVSFSMNNCPNSMKLVNNAAEQSSLSLRFDEKMNHFNVIHHNIDEMKKQEEKPVIGSVKVSVIDLDDKSDYRSVEEISKRDEKVYALAR